MRLGGSVQGARYLYLCYFLREQQVLGYLLASLPVESEGSVVNFFVLLVVHELDAFSRKGVLGWTGGGLGELEGIDGSWFWLLVVKVKHLEACSEEVRNIISKNNTVYAISDWGVTLCKGRRWLETGLLLIQQQEMNDGGPYQRLFFAKIKQRKFMQNVILDPADFRRGLSQQKLPQLCQQGIILSLKRVQCKPSRLTDENRLSYKQPITQRRCFWRGRFCEVETADDYQSFLLGKLFSFTVKGKEERGRQGSAR